MVLTALFLVLAPAKAQDLSIIGECPGEVTIDMTGFTPGGFVGIIVGDGLGDMVVPGGPCIGADTGLESLRAWYGPLRDLDPDGRLMVHPSLSPEACDARFVLLDLTSCAVSSPVSITLDLLPEEEPDCAVNPLWDPVDCVTSEWVWSSDRAFTSVDSADAERVLWSDEWGLSCSLDGTGWVSTETFTMVGCNDTWWHIGGRYTGDCGGHDGESVKRLTMDDLGCYDYRDLPM